MFLNSYIRKFLFIRVLFFIIMFSNVFVSCHANDLAKALGVLKAKLLVLACSLNVKDFKMPTFKEGEPSIENPGSFKETSEKYGNKTTNLYVLSAMIPDLSKAIKESKNTVSVPVFCGVSHSDINDFLSNTEFKEKFLRQYWDEFCNAQKSNAEKLTVEAKKILAEIRKKIINAFKGDISISLCNHITNFIQGKEKKLLMVRSTGHEDTKNIANAGGNESVVGVAPKLKDVCVAIGRVVASYFSEKSLMQRLQLGDDIKKEPFMPVLLQVMVGEYGDRKNKIPVSGVMFTQEPMGHTPDVVNIEAAYGHGEGVVNSKVAVDRFYCGASGLIHPVIREKPYRLKSDPDNNNELKIEQNDRKIANMPSLPVSVVQDLNKIARHIEKIYDCAMDIEFVVIKKDDENYNMYVLQARPINKETVDPTYLTDAFIKAKKKDEKKEGSSIVVAEGKAWEIKNINEILMCDDIAIALKVYEDLPSKKDIHVVFVKKMTAVTSHEATTFRGYSKPVLMVDQEKSIMIEAWLGAGSIFVDTQRALVIKAGNGDVFDSCIENGWTVHPIPLELSTEKSFLDASLEFYMKYQNALSQRGDSGKKSLKKLLDSVSSNNQKKIVQEALNTILSRVANFIEKKILNQLGDKHSLYGEATQLFKHVLLCASEILCAVDENKYGIERLYPVTFLKALLFQQPDRETCNGLSYVTLVRQVREEVALRKRLPELKNLAQKEQEYLVQFLKSEIYILNEKNRKLLVDFVKGMTHFSKKNRLELFGDWSLFIKKLINWGIFEIWLNTSFIDACKNKNLKYEKDILSIIKTLLDELKEESDTIDWIHNTARLVESWERRVGEWSEPDRFERLYKEFCDFTHELIEGAKTAEHLNGWLKDNQLYSSLVTFAEKDAPITSRFTKAGRLGKMIILQLAKKLVDMYDVTIKNLTGSPHYKGNEKICASRFALMLQAYLILMEQWVIMCKNDEKNLMLIIEGNPDWSWPFEKYVKEIRVVFNPMLKNASEDDVKASEFSVAAGSIGSKVDFNRAYPQTLEDLFTLMHQNMLVCFSSLNLKFGMQCDCLPGWLSKISKSLNGAKIIFENKGEEFSCVGLIGIEYNYPTVKLFFNLPLRQHSAVLSLEYHIKDVHLANFSIKFMGHNENNRMFSLGGYANLASLASGYVFASPIQIIGAEFSKGTSMTMQLSWILDEKSDFETIKKYVKLFADVTMISSGLPLCEMIKEVDLIQNTHEKTSKTKIDVLKTTQEFMEEISWLNDISLEFFKNDTYCNKVFWLNDIDQKNYNQALTRIAATLSVLERQGRYDLVSLTNVNKDFLGQKIFGGMRVFKIPSLWDDLLNILHKNKDSAVAIATLVCDFFKKNKNWYGYWKIRENDPNFVVLLEALIEKGCENIKALVKNLDLDPKKTKSTPKENKNLEELKKKMYLKHVACNAFLF